ncbi:hypothetical protein Taro_014947 [Colocasia esculenta]|uniref:Uncharacterized protein n=1 Tax=Colocasia esculenta TaxID=4460 RepID=A0A843URS3_COLES|nr:hypothetical protein [Colocasia esculenta]
MPGTSRDPGPGSLESDDTDLDGTTQVSGQSPELTAWLTKNLGHPTGESGPAAPQGSLSVTATARVVAFWMRPTCPSCSCCRFEALIVCMCPACHALSGMQTSTLGKATSNPGEEATAISVGFGRFSVFSPQEARVERGKHQGIIGLRVLREGGFVYMAGSTMPTVVTSPVGCPRFSVSQAVSSGLLPLGEFPTEPVTSEAHPYSPQVKARRRFRYHLPVQGRDAAVLGQRP